MRSEMRSAAMALVEDRRETFEPPHADDEVKARLGEALRRIGPPRSLRFSGEWNDGGGRAVFEARFAPATRTRLFLNTCSVALVLLFAATAWVFYSGETAALKVSLLLFTGLTVFMFPLVVTALGTARQAEESRIRGAIRRALDIEAT